jgi:opacity protein-like surface antigen
MVVGFHTTGTARPSFSVRARGLNLIHNPIQQTQQMNIRIASGLAAAALLASPLAQAAPATGLTGWSYDVSAGVLWLNSVSDSGIDLSFDNGWAINAGVGYEVVKNLSVGASLGYANAELDAISSGGSSFDLGGDVAVVPLLGTVKYRVPLTDDLSFSVGLGLGAVHSEVEVNDIGGESVSINGNGWELGWQATAELNYTLSTGVDFGVGYRYVSYDQDLDGHLVQAGLTFRF